MTQVELNLYDNLRLSWEQVLGQGTSQDITASFFDLGGNSLLVVQLWVSIETFYEGSIDVDKFMSQPTFETMYQLLAAHEGGCSAKTVTVDISPLPSDLYLRLLSFVDQWPGRRVTVDRLMTSFNTGGQNIPVFFICQGGSEAESLADMLGPEHPLYAMRSGWILLSYTQDEIDCLVSRYLDDIEIVCPEGPLVVAAMCQGGLLADPLAIALRERGRDVVNLTIIDWHFGALNHSGPTHLIYGLESIHNNEDSIIEGMVGHKIGSGKLTVNRITGTHGGYSYQEMAERMREAILPTSRRLLDVRPRQRDREMASVGRRRLRQRRRVG